VRDGPGIVTSTHLGMGLGSRHGTRIGKAATGGAKGCAACVVFVTRTAAPDARGQRSTR